MKKLACRKAYAKLDTSSAHQRCFFVNTSFREAVRRLVLATDAGFAYLHGVQQKNVVWVKNRADILNFVRPGGVGVELGVAAGDFAEQLSNKSVLGQLYGVDRYLGDRGHDEAQLTEALKRTERFGSAYKLIVKTFDEALVDFGDESLDFVYIDGYAHTGQDEGKTIWSWWRKVRSGGVISGDDYSAEFPLVIREVDQFVHANKLLLTILLFRDRRGWSSQHPSWFCVKP